MQNITKLVPHLERLTPFTGLLSGVYLSFGQFATQTELVPQIQIRTLAWNQSFHFFPLINPARMNPYRPAITGYLSSVQIL